jgi:hypothetical protein
MILYSGPLNVDDLGTSFEKYVSSPHFKPNFFRQNGKNFTKSQRNLLVATVDMTSNDNAYL